MWVGLPTSCYTHQLETPLLASELYGLPTACRSESHDVIHVLCGWCQPAVLLLENLAWWHCSKKGMWQPCWVLSDFTTVKIHCWATNSINGKVSVMVVLEGLSLWSWNCLISTKGRNIVKISHTEVFRVPLQCCCFGLSFCLNIWSVDTDRFNEMYEGKYTVNNP